MDNEEIVRRIVEAHSVSVYHFCRSLTVSQADAEDLYQDTFLNFFEKEERIVDVLKGKAAQGTEWIASDETRNYLMGISVKLWKNKYRKQARRRNIAPMTSLEEYSDSVADMEATPEEAVVTRDSIEEVRRQIADLPEKLRIVLMLFYGMDMSAEEIAKNMHLPASTVRNRLCRARKKIKEKMEARGYE